MRLALAAIVGTALLAFVAASREGDTRDPVPAADRASAVAAEIAALQPPAGRGEADALTRLAGLYLTRARETGDAAFFEFASTHAERALAAAPDDAHAMIVAGGAALALHDFERALALGERARVRNPDVAAAYGVLTDAYVELGRYDEALAAVQEMVDRRPDYASYSRVSYLRELHGDLDGAVEAMERAASAGTGIAFDEAWARVVIGDLHLKRGDIEAAGRSYARAAALLPGDAMVQAGEARLYIAKGDLAGAEQLLRAAVTARPLPEYATALGDLLASQGRLDEADEQYALVRASQRLFAASGVDSDLELALFEAEHGEDARVALEGALAAYRSRPSVHAAAIVAWAAYRAGELEMAQAYMLEALRLGTREPRFAHHAAVIFRAAGDDAMAEEYEREAHALRAAQSPLYAADYARRPH
jgi:pentatricopeptide repeat protein